jgi:plasmid replication initiation protein
MLSSSGTQYKLFLKAVKECHQCPISICVKTGENEEKEWKDFVWFTLSTFDEKAGRVTMKFSDELAKFLVNMPIDMLV